MLEPLTPVQRFFQKELTLPEHAPPKRDMPRLPTWMRMERKRQESGLTNNGSSKKPRLEESVTQECQINPVYTLGDFPGMLKASWL